MSPIWQHQITHRMFRIRKKPHTNLSLLVKCRNLLMYRQVSHSTLIKLEKYFACIKEVGNIFYLCSAHFCQIRRKNYPAYSKSPPLEANDNGISTMLFSRYSLRGPIWVSIIHKNTCRWHCSNTLQHQAQGHS